LLNLNTANNVLIIRLSSLGDILLATPLIRSIKKQFPSINTDFLLREQYADVLKFNPYVRDLLTLKGNYEELAGIISQNKYDLIIDLQNNLRSNKLIAKSGAKKVYFKKHDFDKFLLVKFKINRMKNLPQIPVRYSNALSNFSLDEEGIDIFIPEEIKSNIKNKNDYIGLAPGSRHFTKMWPKENYIHLAKMLLARNFKVVLLGGSKDNSICEEISRSSPGSINLCNEDNILQIASDMKKCKAVVCNDSGLMHTACAAGTPVLAFFGSTVEEFGFTPYRNKNLILENNSLSCRPCSHIGRDECPKNHFKCMIELTPEIAFNKLNQLLNT
jgi:lipopolysaccharide heptosyltransferase II